MIFTSYESREYAITFQFDLPGRVRLVSSIGSLPSLVVLTGVKTREAHQRANNISSQAHDPSKYLIYMWIKVTIEININLTRKDNDSTYNGENFVQLNAL